MGPSKQEPQAFLASVLGEARMVVDAIRLLVKGALGAPLLELDSKTLIYGGYASLPFSQTHSLLRPIPARGVQLKAGDIRAVQDLSLIHI